MTDDVHDDEAAPGWDAIDAALSTLYPGVVPRRSVTSRRPFQR
jgi:hypothetical protein